EEWRRQKNERLCARCLCGIDGRQNLLARGRLEHGQFHAARLRRGLQRSDVIRHISCHRDQEAEAIDPTRLLRTHREWPSRRRAAEKCDELAPFHSITSSARANPPSRAINRNG